MSILSSLPPSVQLGAHPQFNANEKLFRARYGVDKHYHGPVIVPQRDGILCAACLFPVSTVERINVSRWSFHPRCLACARCGMVNETAVVIDPELRQPVCWRCAGHYGHRPPLGSALRPRTGSAAASHHRRSKYRLLDLSVARPRQFSELAGPIASNREMLSHRPISQGSNVLPRIQGTCCCVCSLAVESSERSSSSATAAGLSLPAEVEGEAPVPPPRAVRVHTGCAVCEICGSDVKATDGVVVLRSQSRNTVSVCHVVCRPTRGGYLPALRESSPARAVRCCLCLLSFSLDAEGAPAAAVAELEKIGFCHVQCIRCSRCSATVAPGDVQMPPEATGAAKERITCPSCAASGPSDAQAGSASE